MVKFNLDNSIISMIEYNDYTRNKNNYVILNKNFFSD